MSTRVRVVDTDEAFEKALILAGIPRIGEIICLRKKDTTSGTWEDQHYRVNDVVYLEDFRTITVEGTGKCGVDLYVSRALCPVWQLDNG
jgi:hypothetical protein